jgi:hypothetical protein
LPDDAYGNGIIYVTIQDYVYCAPTTVKISLEVEDNIVTKFTNTNFTYRVGNENAIALGSLFAVKAGKDIIDNQVNVTFETITGNAKLADAYKPTNNWETSTIQFTGTGVVEITITEPTSEPKYTSEDVYSY